MPISAGMSRDAHPIVPYVLLTAEPIFGSVKFENIYPPNDISHMPQTKNWRKLKPVNLSFKFI
jgi:hypothetical protein